MNLYTFIYTVTAIPTFRLVTFSQTNHGEHVIILGDGRQAHRPNQGQFKDSWVFTSDPIKASLSNNIHLNILKCSQDKNKTSTLDHFKRWSFEVGVYMQCPDHINARRLTETTPEEGQPLQYVKKHYKEYLDENLYVTIKLEVDLTEGMVIDCILEDGLFKVRLGQDELVEHFPCSGQDNVWFYVYLGPVVQTVQLDVSEENENDLNKSDRPLLESPV
jgi:hypothetical protein